MENSLEGGTETLDAGSLAVAAATDVGLRRNGNEDSHVIWAPESEEERRSLGTLLVVADGMGGANAGEVASHLAAGVVLETWREMGAADPLTALDEAISRANATIHEQASRNAEQRGMGTTCTAVAIRGRRLWLAHVGDSRAILVRGETFRRITHDHSLVAELLERGHLTPEEAQADSRRNQLTRCVGALPQVAADVMELGETLEAGDTVVLCSDGLHGLVTEGEIAMIAGDRAPAAGCEELIALANDRGGPDNITVLIARVSGTRTTSASPAWRRDKRVLIVGLVLLMLALGWAIARIAGGNPAYVAGPPPASATAR